MKVSQPQSRNPFPIANRPAIISEPLRYVWKVPRHVRRAFVVKHLVGHQADGNFVESLILKLGISFAG